MSDRSVEVKDSSVGVVSTGDNARIRVVMGIPLKPIHWIIAGIVGVGILAFALFGFEINWQNSKGDNSSNVQNVKGDVYIGTPPAKPNP